MSHPKLTKQKQNKQQLQHPKRVFSGTRATGRLHLGNYLGAVKGYIALQDDPEYDCLYMAVDLHAITTPYDSAKLTPQTREIIIDYLAAGLDPEKSIITAQSLVPEHTYLSFLFSSVVTVARMQHLPTFNDQIKQHPAAVTMALLNYPVLMAADILVYQAQLVPVGIDQEPHLEVAREIARKMNDRFALNLPEPKRFATKGEYVPSLQGSGKMSKSVTGSYINLTDDLATIKERLAATPTDSGQGKVIKKKQQLVFTDQSGQESPGVASLIKLVELFEGQAKAEHYQELYQGTGVRYQQLKQELAQAIYQELEPIQAKRQELVSKPDYVDDIIQTGAQQARKIAAQTLSQIKNKMGLLTYA